MKITLEFVILALAAMTAPWLLLILAFCLKGHHAPFDDRPHAVKRDW